MTDPPTAPPRRSSTMAHMFLAICAIAMIGLGVVSLLPAAFSGTILDPPGSERQPAAVALMLAVLTFPASCCYAAGKTIAELMRGRLHSGARWLMLPLHRLASAKNDFPRVKMFSTVGWIAGLVAVNAVNGVQSPIRSYLAGGRRSCSGCSPTGCRTRRR